MCNCESKVLTDYTQHPADSKQARDLLGVLQEAKQEIDPRLAEMARYGGGGGGGRYGGYRGRGGGGGGRHGGEFALLFRLLTLFSPILSYFTCLLFVALFQPSSSLVTLISIPSIGGGGGANSLPMGGNRRW